MAIFNSYVSLPEGISSLMNGQTSAEIHPTFGRIPIDKSPVSIRASLDNWCITLQL